MKLSPLFKSVLVTGLIGTPALSMAADSNKIAALEEQMNLLADQIENAKNAGNSTKIGGYGELHYNSLDSGKEIDFHRFVLFLSQEFTDKIRFHSELELEHSLAGDGKPGEIELEQAYIEFDTSRDAHISAGLFLLPVGMLNETHEPETFYGVERNPVEKNIIPTTWWEAGAMYSKNTASGLSYDVAIHSGLNTSAADNYAPRKGRQKVAEAQADDLALTGRIKWTGTNGLELSATLQHQADITQGNDATAGAASLIEAHARWSIDALTLTALTTQWSLDGDGPKAIGADKQTGSYFEASYKLNARLGVFARHNQWDNSAGTSAATQKTQTDFGINYWPHEKVVVKFDYMEQGDAANDKGYNLGIGYSF